jgi:hypothetical protein
MVCHGVRPWEDEPVRHPRIHRYVAVDTATRTRLTQAGIDATRVTTVPNFVSLDRFPRRDALPVSPRTATIFSNYVSPDSSYLHEVRDACTRRGLSLSVLGVGVGHVTSDPAAELRRADVVFAQGRSALEALAVGCVVVVATSRGLGPLVTSANVAKLRSANFGLRVASDPLTSSAVTARLDQYDPQDAQLVTQAIRRDIDVTDACHRLLDVYATAIADHDGPTDHALEAQSFTDYETLLQGARTHPTYDELSSRWLTSRHG